MSPLSIWSVIARRSWLGRKYNCMCSAEESDGPFVYLDYNATTPLAPEVLESIHDALANNWANPSSSHSLGALDLH